MSKTAWWVVVLALVSGAAQAGFVRIILTEYVNDQEIAGVKYKTVKENYLVNCVEKQFKQVDPVVLFSAEGAVVKTLPEIPSKWTSAEDGSLNGNIVWYVCKEPDTK